MFCKWCGGKLASSDTRCKRCGKEVPALSDCGGFYDLVPNAKQIPECHSAPAVPPEGMSDAPPKPESSEEAAPVRQEPRDRKIPLGLTFLTTAGFVIVSLLLIIVLGNVRQYSDVFDGMRNDLRTIDEKMDAIQMPVQPVEAEPGAADAAEAPDSVSAGEENVIITLTLPGEDWPQKASIIVEDSSGFRIETVSGTYVIDDADYGLSDMAEIYQWQYRFGEESDWADIPVDIFPQKDGAGQTSLTIRKTELEALIADNEEPLELRCEIHCRNADGGSLTIVTEEIGIYENPIAEEQVNG